MYALRFTSLHTHVAERSHGCHTARLSLRLLRVSCRPAINIKLLESQTSTYYYPHLLSEQHQLEEAGAPSLIFIVMNQVCPSPGHYENATFRSTVNYPKQFVDFAKLVSPSQFFTESQGQPSVIGACV